MLKYIPEYDNLEDLGLNIENGVKMISNVAICKWGGGGGQQDARTEE